MFSLNYYIQKNATGRHTTEDENWLDIENYNEDGDS